MKTIIFANGEISDIDAIKPLISKDDYIIAANGGSIHCENLGIIPKLIIGDLDSIPKNFLDKWIDHGIKIIQHEKDKDRTDLELALMFAQKNKSGKTLILGGLGNRWDHSLANLLLASKENFRQMNTEFYSDNDWFYIVSEKIEFTGSPGQTVSILPLGGDANGVSTTGLKWSLENETLSHGSSRGVSNLISSEKVKVSVKEGVLLIIRNRGGL
jgi:thiamine pyrophosphokinase